MTGDHPCVSCDEQKCPATCQSLHDHKSQASWMSKGKQLKDKHGLYDLWVCPACGLEYRQRSMIWNPPLRWRKPRAKKEKTPAKVAGHPPEASSESRENRCEFENCEDCPAYDECDEVNNYSHDLSLEEIEGSEEASEKQSLAEAEKMLDEMADEAEASQDIPIGPCNGYMSPWERCFSCSHSNDWPNKKHRDAATPSTKESRPSDQKRWEKAKPLCHVIEGRPPVEECPRFVHINCGWCDHYSPETDLCDILKARPVHPMDKPCESYSTKGPRGIWWICHVCHKVQYDPGGMGSLDEMIQDHIDKAHPDIATKPAKVKKPKKEKYCQHCRDHSNTYELIDGGTVELCSALNLPCKPGVWHVNDKDLQQKINERVKTCGNCRHSIPPPQEHCDHLVSMDNIVECNHPEGEFKSDGNYVCQIQADLPTKCEFYEKKPAVQEGNVVQPVDAKDAAEYLQNSETDAALVSAGLEAMASVTKDDVKQISTEPKPGDEHLNGDSMYDQILELVKSGKNTYRDIAEGLGIDKRYVKGPVQKLVKCGVLEWDGFAHLKATGCTLKDQALCILKDEPGLSVYQLYRRTTGEEKNLKRIIEELVSTGGVRKEKLEGAGYAERYYIAESAEQPAESPKNNEASGMPVTKIFCLGCHAELMGSAQDLPEAYRQHVSENHGSFKKMVSDMCGAGDGNCLICGKHLPICQLAEHMANDHRLFDNDDLRQLYQLVLPAPIRRRLYELGIDAQVRELCKDRCESAKAQVVQQAVDLDVSYTPRSRSFLEDLRKISYEEYARIGGICWECHKPVYGSDCVTAMKLDGELDGRVFHEHCYEEWKARQPKLNPKPFSELITYDHKEPEKPNAKSKAKKKADDWRSIVSGEDIGVCSCGKEHIKLNDKGEAWCPLCGLIYRPDPAMKAMDKGKVLCTPEVSISCWHYWPEHICPCDAQDPDKGPWYREQLWGKYCGSYAPKLPAIAKDGTKTGVWPDCSKNGKSPKPDSYCKGACTECEAVKRMSSAKEKPKRKWGSKKARPATCCINCASRDTCQNLCEKAHDMRSAKCINCIGSMCFVSKESSASDKTANGIDQIQTKYCIYCGKLLADVGSINQHMREHGRYSPRTHCPYCGKHLKPENFDRHLKNHLSRAFPASVEAPDAEEAEAKAKTSKRSKSAESSPAVKSVAPASKADRPVERKKPKKTVIEQVDEIQRKFIKLPSGQRTLDIFLEASS